ncbi:Endonuclease/exonuclease/phosphatase [Anaeromyxobacter sp. K]|uniref:endonuclease/exonuclease/phosphatase family protein n=1 Tax=Anaeromyxobacter sp. (strain K) TaxID=447217 RepID=UPI00015F909E|nr:endonuclease/exonuclease/phosphatase family protein [Anaeromyxobacter sp. K]ACG73978.1 Endonuclease/exonuclease/phosphatase [Anaeromyxobacter sp. K]
MRRSARTRPAAVLAALALAAACAPPPLDAAPPGTAGERVRIVSWNVHDLFDDVDRTVPPGALDTVATADEVEAKLARVAAVLARLDADLVLLQEVETAALAGALAARAGYAEARLVEGNDPRGIDVAVLSRLPLRAYVSHRDERDASGRPLFPRDCVEAHAALPGGGTLALVGSHLSSALSDDGTRRAEQAARLREVADGLLRAGAQVVAGGDLNDEAGSTALAPLLGDGGWIDPAAALPPEARWTWSGGGARAALDHLAVPRADAGSVVQAAIAGGPDVQAASDHRPVVLDLWLQ